MLEPRSKGAKPAGENKLGTGRGTLRLRSKGPATVEELVCFTVNILTCVMTCLLRQNAHFYSCNCKYAFP